jgi:hypothetical protein
MDTIGCMVRRFTIALCLQSCAYVSAADAENVFARQLNQGRQLIVSKTEHHQAAPVPERSITYAFVIADERGERKRIWTMSYDIRGTAVHEDQLVPIIYDATFNEGKLVVVYSTWVHVIARIVQPNAEGGADLIPLTEAAVVKASNISGIQPKAGRIDGELSDGSLSVTVETEREKRFAFKIDKSPDGKLAWKGAPVPGATTRPASNDKPKYGRREN